METLNVEGAEQQRRLLAWICWGIVLVLGLFLAAFATRLEPGRNVSVVGAQASSIALLVLVVAIVAAAIRPLFGLYAIVFLTLIGDAVTATWFPFAKNLSSRESLLFVSDKLALSPLEILIGMTLVFWIIDVLGRRDRYVVKGPLFGATLLFMAFVLFGFFIGLSKGGDLRIALFEGRAMFVLPLVYILAINLCTPANLRGLAWLAICAININAVLAINYWDKLTPLQREDLESLGEHAASVQLALVILFTLTLWLYKGSSRLVRLLMLLTCIPIVAVFLIAQRRSAAIGLGVGLILLVVSLAWRHRVKFFFALPILIVCATSYTVLFWNSTSLAGFPAQAVKAVISPSEVDTKDKSSDLYRIVENYDINYTIRSAPLTGVGFGRPFLTPAPLPDISFFEFYRYIPHNSILWVWIKTGFLGFMSMMAMFALAIRVGVRSLVKERDPTNASFIMFGIMYVAMFAVFAFVDIAWDARSMVTLALAFALCTHMAPRPARPIVHAFRGVVFDPEVAADEDEDDEDVAQDEVGDLVSASASFPAPDPEERLT